MPDLALDADRAVDLLKAQARQSIERLQEMAAVLEKEIRAVAATLETGVAFDVQHAASIHVFDLDAAPPGLQKWNRETPIEITVGGYSRCVSQLARELPAGKYRAILQLTRIEDEPGRSRTSENLPP